MRFYSSNFLPPVQMMPNTCMGTIYIYLKILLPVLITGIASVSVIAIVKSAAQRKKNKGESEEESDNTYMIEGMTLGMCFGTSIGIVFASDSFYIGTDLGMLFGMLIGMCFKK